MSEVKFRCRECKVEQKDKDALTGHLATEHLQWFPYQCYFCVKEMLPTEQAVKDHFDSFHATKSPKVYCLLDGTKEARLKALTNQSLEDSSYSDDDESPLVCRWFCCQKEFADAFDLKAHVSHGSGHKGERPFVCCRCRAVFAKRGNLIMHAKVKHAYRPTDGGADVKRDVNDGGHDPPRCSPSPAPVQPKQETSEFGARERADAKPMEVEEEVKPQDDRQTFYRYQEDVYTEETANYDGVCDDCDRRFVGFAALQLHITTQHYAGVLSSRDEQQLRKDKQGQKHQRSKVRNRERRFECGVCATQFTRMTILRSHERLHGDTPRPYVCSRCDCTFNTATLLNKHTRTSHKGDKRDYATFMCRCGLGFADADSLQMHTLDCSVLALKMSVQCAHCPTRFTNDAALQRHARLKHGGDFSPEQTRAACSYSMSTRPRQPYTTPTVQHAKPNTEAQAPKTTPFSTHSFKLQVDMAQVSSPSASDPPSVVPYHPNTTACATVGRGLDTMLPERKVNTPVQLSPATGHRQLTNTAESDSDTSVPVPSWNVWKQRWSQTAQTAMQSQ